MKSIYIIGFRGLGRHIEEFENEAALIKLGHVGLAFEGEERIFGFHPTKEACLKIGDDDAVIEWLLENNSLDGTLQDDTTIFVRAYELAQQGERSTVYVMTLTVDDETFTVMHRQALQWYTDQTIFTYAVPKRDEIPPTDSYNCATFLRRVGLTKPDLTGQLVRDIKIFQSEGTEWMPRGGN